MSLSRKERRQMAKNFGLLDKKESFSQMIGRYQRSKQMGSQIHTHNLEEQRNYDIKNQNLVTNTDDDTYSFLDKGEETPQN